MNSFYRQGLFLIPERNGLLRQFAKTGKKALCKQQVLKNLKRPGLDPAED